MKVFFIKNNEKPSIYLHYSNISKAKEKFILVKYTDN